MHLNAYLFFDGNCADAMRFYEKTLGGKLDLIKASDGPPGSAPPGTENLIMHARLVVDDPGAILLASDWMESKQPYEGMKSFSVSVICETVAQAQKIFDAFADGGQVKMPFSETFWAERFGMVTDRYGTPWMVGGGMKSSM